MMRCGHPVGFLTRLPCGEPAAMVCSRCGIPLCGKHLLPGGSGGVCPTCVAADTNSSGHDRSSGRDHDSSYSSSDYDTFDSSDTFAGQGGEMGGGGASGSWVGDSSTSDDSGGDGDAGLFQDS